MSHCAEPSNAISDLIARVRELLPPEPSNIPYLKNIISVRRGNAVIYIHASAWVLRLIRHCEEENPEAADTENPKTSEAASYESVGQIAVAFNRAVENRREVQLEHSESRPATARQVLAALCNCLNELEPRGEDAVERSGSEPGKLSREELVAYVAIALVTPRQSFENTTRFSANQIKSNSRDTDNISIDPRKSGRMSSSTDSRERRTFDLSLYTRINADTTNKTDETRNDLPEAKTKKSLGANKPPTASEQGPSSENKKITLPDQSDANFTAQHGQENRGPNKIKNAITGAAYTPDDLRYALKYPILRQGADKVAVLASSWHGVALVPLTADETVSARDYLINGKAASPGDRIANIELRCDTDYPNVTESFDDSGDTIARKGFLLGETARHLVQLSVAARAVSHAVGPEASTRSASENSNIVAKRANGWKNRLGSNYSVFTTRARMSRVASPCAVVAVGIILYNLVSPTQNGLFALFVVLPSIFALLAVAVMLTWRKFVLSPSDQTDKKLDYHEARDQLNHQASIQKDLRRLRSELQTASLRYWSDLRQDLKTYAFATRVSVDTLGVRRGEEDMLRAINARIEAGDDFKLKVIGYQKKHSRRLRLAATAAISAFVTLSFLQLVMHWYGLQSGGSVYDLVVAALEPGASKEGMSALVQASVVSDVRSIIVTFIAVGAVIVVSIALLGRNLDDD